MVLRKNLQAVLVLFLFTNLAYASSWEAYNNLVQNTKTYKANFQQSVNENQSIINGHISLKFPNQLRWETFNQKSEISQIIIVNATDDKYIAQIFDLDLYQVIIKDLKLDQYITPADILLGKIDLSSNFFLQPPNQNDQEDIGWLIAKANNDSSNDQIKILKIKIINNLLVAIKIIDLLDREIEIKFSDVVINKSIDENVFTLNLPDNVDIIFDTK